MKATDLSKTVTEPSTAYPLPVYAGKKMKKKCCKKYKKGKRCKRCPGRLKMESPSTVVPLSA